MWNFACLLNLFISHGNILYTSSFLCVLIFHICKITTLLVLPTFHWGKHYHTLLTLQVRRYSIEPKSCDGPKCPRLFATFQQNFLYSFSSGSLLNTFPRKQNVKFIMLHYERGLRITCPYRQKFKHGKNSSFLPSKTISGVFFPQIFRINTTELTAILPLLNWKTSP